MTDFTQLGASGAVVITVLLFLKYMREEAIKRDATYLKIAANLNKNTKTTKSFDTYLRERNGRDGEVHELLIKEIHKIPQKMIEVADRNLKAYKKMHQEVNEQHVKSQIVDKAIVKS